MPGSADDDTLRNVFGYVPMPATIEQLDEAAGPNAGLPYRVVHTRLGNGVIQDGDKYWLTDEVMAAGIERANKEISEYQKYVDYLEVQRAALAARKLPPEGENGSKG